MLVPREMGDRPQYSERRLGLDWREDTSGYLFVKLAGEDENTKIPIKAHRRLHAA